MNQKERQTKEKKEDEGDLKCWGGGVEVHAQISVRSRREFFGSWCVHWPRMMLRGKLDSGSFETILKVNSFMYLMEEKKFTLCRSLRCPLTTSTTSPFFHASTFHPLWTPRLGFHPGTPRILGRIGRISRCRSELDHGGDFSGRQE